MLHFTVYGYAELYVYKALFSHFSMIILSLPSYKWITAEWFPYLVTQTLNTNTMRLELRVEGGIGL